MNKKLHLTLNLLILAHLANATASASVDRSTLNTGQSLTLSINLDDSSDAPNLDALKTDFDIYGTSTNSQTNIINGQTSSQTTLVVNLMPKKSGTLLIPPLKVGKDTTQAISITINPPSASDQAQQDSKVFVTGSLDKTATFPGTPVLLRLKLYYGVQLTNVAMAKIDLDNAQIQTAGKEVRYQETRHGSTYQVLEQAFTITPNKPGNLKIPPVSIKGATVENNGQGFFALSSPTPFMINTKELNLQVKPLPAGVKPAEWLPAKKLDISDDWSATSATLKVGQPITRTITIHALGIAPTAIPELNFPTPDNVNAYPDKTQSSGEVNNSELTASKTFKIAYVPTTAGKLEFPAQSIKWWDLSSNSFKTATLAAKTFQVLAAPASSQKAGNLAPSQINPPLSQVSVGTQATTQKAAPFNPWWRRATFIFAGLWLLTLGCLLYLLQILKHKSKLGTDHAEPKSSEKGPVGVSKNLAGIKQACQNQDVSALNSAILAWASEHWQRKIHSLGAIKDLANNPQLSVLIEQLNLALYRGQSFSEFNAIYQSIAAQAATRVSNSPATLAELYPN